MRKEYIETERKCVCGNDEFYHIHKTLIEVNGSIRKPKMVILKCTECGERIEVMNY